MALSGRGIDECVDVPRAVIKSVIPDLSAVEMLTYRTLPSGFFMIHPPSFRANSQSIFSQLDWESVVVLYLPPSSSASDKKMTSRFRGTLLRARRITASANTAASEIQGTASIHIAVLDRSGERIETPLLTFDTDH